LRVQAVATRTTMTASAANRWPTNRVYRSRLYGSVRRIPVWWEFTRSRDLGHVVGEVFGDPEVSIGVPLTWRSAEKDE
jgi:hypothetical protein